MRASISGQGTQGAAVNVQLLEDDALMQEIPVQIADEGGSRELSFKLEHPKVGAFTYRISVPSQGDSTNDNTFAVSVQ